MRNDSDSLGTVTLQNAQRSVTAAASNSGLVMASRSSLLWTPDRGASGLIVVARPRPLAAVIGGRIVEVRSDEDATESGGIRRGLQQVMLGGLVIVSNQRQKEPTRVIGHPDLASGASVQRGETLYVSVAEAIYRESRGEEVEIHLLPTEDDAEALSDLRSRARHRWENDRLPDGWTRPLPPPAPREKTLDTAGSGELSPDLRALAERFRTKEEERDL